MSRGRLVTVALALVVGCSSGARGDSAAAVSERFVDLYFIEIDQQRALGITDGPAHATLEKELTEVGAIRREYTPAQAKASVYWERTYLEETGDGARAIYDLTIKSERDEDRRHVLITMRKLPAGWRVTSFTVKEGAALRAPR
jgi:hypothetical protein